MFSKIINFLQKIFGIYKENEKEIKNTIENIGKIKDKITTEKDKK